MRVFLTLMAALAALHAHGLIRIPRRLGFRAALRAFVVGATATAATQALAARPSLHAVLPLLLVVGAVAALVAWIGLIRLVSFETRGRDVPGRVVALGLALLLALLNSSPGTVATIVLCGILTWRWKRELTTRARFALGVGAIGLAVVLLLHAGHPATRGLGSAAAALDGFARAVLIASAWYSLFGAVSLLRAWAKDPSLGIRRVSRRLTLSHVFVGLVPLALVIALWTVTTVLGVLNERAIVGARAIEALGRGLRNQLTAALATSDDPRARLASLPAAVAPGAPVAVWQRRGDALDRVAGPELVPSALARLWLDSLAALPAHGVVALGDSAFIGAAAAGPSGEAVVLIPMREALATLPDSVARARLGINSKRFARTSGASYSIGPEGEPPARADSTPVVSVADSAEAMQVRRVLRGVGIDDSAVTVRTGPRASKGMTFGGNRMAETPLDFFLEGHALTPGIAWIGSRLARADYLVTAKTPWRDVIGGLAVDVRANPLTVVPLVLVLLFAVAIVIIVMIDLQMVGGMAGSITRAVGALDGAAARLRAGDLSHRIEIAGEDDLWRVASAFNTATEGLERAREAEKEQVRIENELDVARRIQARLLPAAPPKVRGLEVAGLYDPAREVGGDYYDHIALDDHRVLLVIADVSGKSVPAALIMAGFRAALVSQDLPACDPGTLAERLNGFLNDSLDPGKFVTAFIAMVDGTNGRIAYVNAGHNPPVLRRADGRYETLVQGGTILGIIPGSRYERGETTLEPGDLLLLYTDGVPEGMSPDSELWGDERLIAALGAHSEESCAMLVRSIAGAVRAFEGEQGPADDVTLIAVRRTPG